MDQLKRRHIPLSPPPPYMDLYEHIPLDDHEYPKEKTLKPRFRWHTLSSKKFAHNKHLVMTVILTLLSFWTRFRQIGKSATVVWDEAHFGKFGSYYLKNEFYFDVHPPLGKMLVGLSGWMASYNGTFGFESGATYPESVNYTFMRLFNATWGALLVPIAYQTARQFHMTNRASLLAAIMVLCDTAYLCISRFILLDSMLLFFTAASLYTLAVFHNCRSRPFSLSWWLWLSLTGFSLGCVLSVKWVGLFAIALVGCYTLEELWDMLGDLEMPKTTYAGHWLARALCLIVLPGVIYIASFKVHFMVLYKSGPGDAQMSSLFQSQLEGNSLSNNPIELAYGSVVSIKNCAYGGGLLHSHPHLYPEGSQQQQVTCYHHKDDNNNWVILPIRSDKGDKMVENAELIKNGAVIRLFHRSTGRNLHSHPLPAPLTIDDWEVSAYGNDTVGDVQDYWQIETVKDIAYDPSETVRALSTQFRLRHVHLGCYLAARNKLLPQWGYKQIEVTCVKNAGDGMETVWNVEEHQHDQLPSADKARHRSRFFHDFWHLNVAMWNSNNMLIPDPDKDDILSSTPLQWPTVSVGLRMCGWGDEQIKYYLLGNPVVWWSAVGSVLVFLMATLTYCIRQRREIKDMSEEGWSRFTFVGKTLVMGWLLHYMPFFIMGRVMYLHHYFPSLYFSILLFPFLLDHFTRHMSSRWSQAVISTASLAVIAVFIYFSPIAYGMSGPIKNYSGRQWRDTWNLVESYI